MPAISFENQIMPGTFEHTVDYLVKNRIDTRNIDTRYEAMTPARQPIRLKFC
jgi:hypothetical protein